MARRSDFHFDLPKGNGTRNVLRHITKRVLLAKITSDSRRHAGDGFGLTGEVGESSSIFAEAAEKGRVFFSLFGTDQGYGVDQSLGLASLSQNLGVLEMTGIVSAVADDDESFFTPAGVLQVVEPFTDGIVESGASPRGDSVEGFLEILRIAGKGLSVHEFNRHVIIEIHDKHLILWIAGMNEGVHRGNDIRELAAHASAVVNDEADGDRSVALIKYGNLLRLPFFKDAKVVQLETGDGCSVGVSYIDRQQDKIHGERNFRLGVHVGW